MSEKQKKALAVVATLSVVGLVFLALLPRAAAPGRNQVVPLQAARKAPEPKTKRRLVAEPVRDFLAREILFDQDGNECREVAVEADFDRPLKQMIKAGKYDYYNPMLSSEEIFPRKPGETGKKEAVFALFRIPEGADPMFSAAVASELARRGYRFATPREAFIFGEHFPHMLGRNPIETDGDWTRPDTSRHYFISLAVVGGPAKPEKTLDFCMPVREGFFSSFERVLAVKTGK